MALSVGEKFKSFDEVSLAISKFESDNFVNLYKKESRTVAAAAKKCPNRVFRPELKYSELNFACVRNGKYRSTVVDNSRPNQSTIRSGCEFCIKLRSYDGQHLSVYQHGPPHNHVCSKDEFMHHVGWYMTDAGMDKWQNGCLLFRLPGKQKWLLY